MTKIALRKVMMLIEVYMLKFKLMGWVLVACMMIGYSVSSAQAVQVGVALSVSGDAWLLTGGSKKALNKGDSLQSFQTIVTGEHGRVRLLMEDKSKMYLSPKSRVKLQDYKVKKGQLISASISMLWGKVRFFVNKLRKSNASFRVHTRTAVLGVRGTEYNVFVAMPDGVNPFDASLILGQLPQMEMTVEMVSGVVVLTTAKGQTFVLNKGTTTKVNLNGDVNTGSISESESGNDTGNDTGNSEGGEGNQGSSTNEIQQAVNQLANTVGAGASAVQGSTITTPPNYRFGGR
ncbi:MAG: FecR domain-containing protein [Ghiorsea sp.]